MKRASSALPSTIALAVLTACASTPAKSGNPEGFGAEVFVFKQRRGPDLVLDFKRNTERLGSKSARLLDCSDARYWCVRGDVVRIVLPKDCSEAGGPGPWSRSGVTTRVLYAYTDSGGPHGGFGSLKRRFLGESTWPYAAYQYDTAAGVYVIAYDFKKTRLVDLAASDLSDFGDFFGGSPAATVSWHAYETRPLGGCLAEPAED